MKSILSEITLELTQSCPNKCLFCSSCALPFAKSVLPLDAVLSIMRDARQLGAGEIALSGGEPLGYPFVDQVLCACRDNDLSVAFYTSGQTLNNDASSIAFVEWNDLIPTDLRNAFRLVFNIQSSIPEEHDTITQNPSSHMRAMRSLRAAQEAGLRTEINLVPNGVTRDTLLNSIEKFLAMGVSRVHLLRMVEQGYYHKNKSLLYLSEENLNAIIEAMNQRFSGDQRIRLGIPLSTTDKRCTAGTEKLVVRYDGEILPCEAFKEQVDTPKFSLGNVMNGDSLMSAHRAATHHSLLCFLKGDKATEYCRGMESCAALRYKRSD